MVDTDKQNLSLSGSTIGIDRGTSVNLGSLLNAADDQTLSVSGSTLSIANGNSVTLPSGSDNLARTIHHSKSARFLFIRTQIIDRVDGCFVRDAV